jgi:hypothetical protein
MKDAETSTLGVRTRLPLPFRFMTKVGLDGGPGTGNSVLVYLGIERISFYVSAPVHSEEKGVAVSCPCDVSTPREHRGTAVVKLSLRDLSRAPPLYGDDELNGDNLAVYTRRIKTMNRAIDNLGRSAHFAPSGG